MRVLRVGQRGFGVNIERQLMVAVLAMLLAIVVPNFVRARAHRQLAECRNNLRLYQSALESYADKHEGRYPASLGELPLGSVLKCPQSDSPYLYNHSSDPADLFLVRCPQEHNSVNRTAPQISPVSGLTFTDQR